MEGRLRLGTVGAWVGRIRQLPASEAIAVAIELEALGYSALWISEGMGKEILAHATLLLGATEHLTVAMGVASIWARDPISMRNGMRTIEEAFPGRLVVGLGVSHAPMVRTRGQLYRRPVERMSMYLDRMEEAPYDGPAPTQDPPLLLGALGPKMLELAADRCGGAHPYATTPGHTGRARAIVGSRPVLAPEQGAVLDRDRARARDIARGHLRLHLGLTNYRNSLQRQGWGEEDLADGGSDRLIDALAPSGAPEVVVEAIHAHLAAGADHVALQLYGAPGVPVPMAAYRAMAPHVVDMAVGG